MKTIRLIIGTALLVASPALRAMAQIEPLTQTRTVSAAGYAANGSFGEDGELVSAPDFGAFEAAADISVGNESSRSQADASQQSQISAGRLTASGTADSVQRGCCGSFGNAVGQGESIYDVRFNLPAF